MLPELDVLFPAVLAFILIGLTILAFRGDSRATKWGRKFVGITFGPFLSIFFLNRMYAFSLPIGHLEGALVGTPRAAIGDSSEAIQALVRALRFTNWFPFCSL
jgi:hypothetical protein